MTAEEAIAFVRRHGVVLEASSGAVPSLVAAIVGAPVRGSWWSHPRGKEIFEITRAVRASEEILVCRLIAGKLTFVHRKLWPALVRCVDRFPIADLARLSEEHTSNGRHVVTTVPFPDWVLPAILVEAGRLTEPAALEILHACIPGMV